MSQRPFKRGPSPWGTIQTISQIDHAGELFIVSTPGHGGMWIGPDLRPRFRQLFPDFQGYAGFPWLEEDCDICLGVIAFPEFFQGDKVRMAHRMVRAMRNYFVSANEVLDKREADAMAVIDSLKAIAVPVGRCLTREEFKTLKAAERILSEAEKLETATYNED